MTRKLLRTLLLATLACCFVTSTISALKRSRSLGDLYSLAPINTQYDKFYSALSKIKPIPDKICLNSGELNYKCAITISKILQSSSPFDDANLAFKLAVESLKLSSLSILQLQLSCKNKKTLLTYELIDKFLFGLEEFEED